VLHFELHGLLRFELSVARVEQRIYFSREVVLIDVRCHVAKEIHQSLLVALDDLGEGGDTLGRQRRLKVHDGAEDFGDVLAVVHQRLFQHHDVLLVLLARQCFIRGRQGDAEVVQHITDREAERDLRFLFAVPDRQRLAEGLELPTCLHVEPEDAGELHRDSMQKEMRLLPGLLDCHGHGVGWRASSRIA